MGYTTHFGGRFKFDVALSSKQIKFLQAFHDTRRMGRDIKILNETTKGADGLPFIFKPVDELGRSMKQLEDEFGLDVDGYKRTPEEIYGNEGAYYVGYEPVGIIDNNTPPGQLVGFDAFENNREKITKGECQPGLWCKWRPTDDGKYLEWDGVGKFYYYSYSTWLKYIIEHFLNPWEVNLNGKVRWGGEEESDGGLIEVKDNVVKTLKITFNS